MQRSRALRKAHSAYNHHEKKASSLLRGLQRGILINDSGTYNFSFRVIISGSRGFGHVRRLTRKTKRRPVPFPDHFLIFA